jgi:T5orf172 domain
MAVIKLPFVQQWVDRRGGGIRTRYYFRKPGHARVSLPGLPGSSEFNAAYEAAIANAASQIKLKYVNNFRDRHGRMRHYFRRDGKTIALPEWGTPEFMRAYQAAMADAGQPVDAAAMADAGQPVDVIDAICHEVRKNRKNMGKEVVYFVQIGEHVKIGTTRKLKERLGAFKNAVVEVRLLFVMPGGRELERRVHKAFANWKIAREIFRPDIVDVFIARVKSSGAEDALEFMRNAANTWDEVLSGSECHQSSRTSRSEMDRARWPQKKQEERIKRKMLARMSRHEENIYYASLVADRKQRLGW